MQQDGPRRQGRFIKSGSKVMSKVSLVDFSFAEINDAPVITPDNAKRSIIHVSYHEQRELKESILHPDGFNDDLTTRENTRPVIFPLDFTKEWERDKKMRKDRVSRTDDEEFDYELEAERQAEELSAQATHQAGTPESTPAEPPVTTPKAPAGGVKPADAQAKATSVAAKLASGGANQWDSMDVVGKAIKGFMGAPGEDGDGQDVPPSTSDFIPTQTAPAATATPQPGTVVDPEAGAAEEYRARVERLKADEQRLQEKLQTMMDEAKAQGYRDGIRMGEEKAELQARQHATELFGKVTELINEFSGLKHEVLSNVQENFYELCQAMAEALVKREFSIHPEAFVTVLRRAIAETVEPGKFKIRVHPETYDRIAGLGSSDVLAAMQRDAEVAPGDFKIESEMSVVDVNVTKMIRELLDQADLTLFKEDKAG